MDTAFGIVRTFDDFNRPVIDTDVWDTDKANSGVNFAINTQVSGVIRGTVTDNSRDDTSVVQGALNYRANLGGPLVLEMRAKKVTNLATSVFLGLSDSVDVEVPLQWSNNAFTSPASDAVGFYHGATLDTWKYGGVADDVDSVQSAVPVADAPVLDNYQTFRVQVNGDGAASFFVDGNIVEERVAGCTRANIALLPKAAIRDDGEAGSLDIDYIYIANGRVA